MLRTDAGSPAAGGRLQHDTDTSLAGGSGGTRGAAVNGALASVHECPSTLRWPKLGDIGHVLLGSVYADAHGPNSVVPLFLLGSYLGVFGLELMLGSVLGSTPIGLPLGIGVVLLSLSLVALVTSLANDSVCPTRRPPIPPLTYR